MQLTLRPPSTTCTGSAKATDPQLVTCCAPCFSVGSFSAVARVAVSSSTTSHRCSRLTVGSSPTSRERPPLIARSRTSSPLPAPLCAGCGRPTRSDCYSRRQRGDTLLTDARSKILISSCRKDTARKSLSAPTGWQLVEHLGADWGEPVTIAAGAHPEHGKLHAKK